MNNYFDNVLKGFVPTECQVELGEYTRMSPDFLVIDVDQDDMPEILFGFKYGREKYVGVLKRENRIWRLCNVSSEPVGNSNGVFALVNLQDEVCITPRDIGKAMTLRELFPSEDNGFIGMIDGKLYYGKLVATEDDENLKKKYEATPNLVNANMSGNGEVIDFAQGDVTGSGCMDNVSLSGERIFGDVTGFTKNMKIKIEGQSCQETLQIDLPEVEGYSPRIFVGDFTGDGIPEMLVTIYSQPNGGYTYHFIYTAKNATPKLIFDSRDLNKAFSGSVQYADGYKVIVETNELGKRYVMDISYKGLEYLEPLYDSSGKLKVPVEGKILDIIALNPEDFNDDGIYTISTERRIIGTSIEDTLGLLDTYFKWSEGLNQFVPFMEYVSLIGQNI